MMEKNIFKPLGMKSTSVRFTSDLLKRMATHYGPTGDPHPTYGHAPTDGPQRSILSIGEDMSKYMIMQLQNGKFGDEEIVTYGIKRRKHAGTFFVDGFGA